MLIVIMLIVFLLTVIMLIVIMLIVMAPFKTEQTKKRLFRHRKKLALRLIYMSDLKVRFCTAIQKRDILKH
jgi:hypothetical protein